MDYKTDTNLAIHVTDLALAKSFYTTVLGFVLLEETDERLVFSTESLTLFVVKDEIIMPFIPALGVDDLDNARRHLESNNGKIVREFEEMGSFYFADPFGIVWDVNEL